MFFRTLGLVTLCVTLTACNITGTAQKGPFKAGSTVSITQLDSQASPLPSTTMNTQISGTQGRFSVDGIEWSGWTELVATGQYFNEFENAVSDSALTLNAITNKNRRFDTANINLLTHLAAARMRQRVADGQSRNRAWRSTQVEIKQTFGLQSVSQNINRGVEQLDLIQGSGRFRKDNANLLLFTGAFLASGGNEDNLQSLTNDFADDGEFNGGGESLFSAIAIAGNTPNLLQTVSQNLASYGVRNPPNSDDMQQLPSWVNTDASNTDTLPPVITLEGDNPAELTVGDVYTDAGATATDNVDEVVVVEIISNTVDTAVAGTYEVKYSATDAAGNSAEAIRQVVVSTEDDTSAPVINISGENPVELTVGDVYTDAGATATDNVDEVVLVEIISNTVDTAVAGTYEVKYRATDVAGNSAEASRLVIVSPAPDNTAPIITITGEANINHPVGTLYIDEGATAEDDVDGAVTVTIDNQVDENILGAYQVVYTATDAANNSATETRTVVVEDTIPPEVTLNGASVIELTVGDEYVELGASATDNYDAEVDVIIQAEVAVNTQVAGTYYVGYSAIDSSMNKSVESLDTIRTVIVSEAPVQIASVNARITTPAGVQLDSVTILASAPSGNISKLSSANGTASIDLVADQEYVLKLTKEGYATQVSPIKTPAAGEQISLDITMIQRGAIQTVDAESGGVIKGVNGASVTIEPGSFVRGDGQNVTGDIEVTITPVDVSSPASLAAFPGEFTGTQLDGMDTPIISFGTVEYKFSQGGQEVRLAEGATADILIPIYVANYQNGNAIQVGDQIPLWSLDEETGIWKQESVGTSSTDAGFGLVVSDPSSPTGLALQATVSHFTWWNCDVSMEAGTANVTVIGSSQGTAKIRAVASEACNIGWRPRIVDMVVNIGETMSNLNIPTSCEVCFSADVSLTAGGFARTDEICETSGPFGNVTIDLLIPDDGPLDIAANASDGPLSISAAVGYASSSVQLGSKTFESDVTYSIASGALPLGLSLNTRNSTEAEIVGIPLEVGNFSVVVEGVNSPDGEIDSVTINYSVVDSSSATLPIFVNDPIYRIIGFEPFGIDLNPYNIGGESTDWSFPLLGSEGFVISSAGLVTYEGQNSGYDTWTGTVRASNAAGFAETTISLCTGDCGGIETPIPGDYALSSSYTAYGYETGELAAKVTVSLNQISPDDIIVNYTTVDYDSTPAATAGVDYVAVTSSVVIPAGETSVEINVDIIDDDLLEDYEEYFYIDISSPTARIEQGRTRGVVRDDDSLILQ